MAMFDLSSSWMEGPTAHWRREAIPATAEGQTANRVRAAHRLRGTAGGDPTAFVTAVEVVREKVGLSRLTLVEDRGMITSARIEALRELGGLSWIICPRAPTIGTP
jgi:hypothetical protein